MTIKKAKEETILGYTMRGVLSKEANKFMFHIYKAQKRVRCLKRLKSIKTNYRNSEMRRRVLTKFGIGL